MRQTSDAAWAQFKQPPPPMQGCNLTPEDRPTLLQLQSQIAQKIGQAQEIVDRIACALDYLPAAEPPNQTKATGMVDALADACIALDSLRSSLYHLAGRIGIQAE